MGDPQHPVGRGEQRAEGCEWSDGFPPSERGPLHVHHTRGRLVTGDDPAYCVTSCGPCNMAAGDPAARDPRHREVTAW